ncbi:MULTISPECIES: glucose-1-phosphate adenylyltransferase [Mucilaginibacter]|jgi:glucose-1-phosphate adenylyltransferase|uniref:Glucose-1-phosphate adenylyltransferase n=2 Tax=Mucilaginibacter TaxID=423349 RepID=A0AAE6JKG2_9SPHI|nr:MULTISPECIES: glucose-1-phosphate adenylyltransferase [Mucilaginibacter]NVM64409.1 glucose-1-phosphate adenylyltransferase [Mucilaginibacter sp. SG538B]QEM07301.1 glucose-1-phosphate adenylyltransferase [Mucilaginibacter rubeus]QEM19754.1 glucose-1-phosphate adenylyltransferase [Mucilaginibacter gossypii]QTE35231.1 glucose-1-phosphate adenylyltransferase [Mucilaginibacter gossypii]QTE43543.1 glucose-1-phosphate adenylyltransferase [Mucilaginibacter rubeus]
MTSKVISIVLGGGQGSRLSPLTATRSKPAVPIAGKYRLVDIPISNCLHSGITRIYVLTQFNSASLNKHIKNTYHFSSFSDAFVDILAAEQTPSSVAWFQGTADAVRQSLHHLAVHEFEYVLILSGDQLYQMDFEDMINHHIETNAEISIATIPVDAADVPGFGILKTDENNMITSFIEKPKSNFESWASEVSPEMEAEGRVYLASMGIYIFNRKLLYELLEGNERTDFGKEIIPQSIEGHRVASYQYEGYWTDIGTIPSFFEANLGLTDNIPKFNLFDKNPIYTRARMLPPSKISGTLMEKSIVADGCIINAKQIIHSIIGIRTRIGVNTIIENCYVMGSDNYQTLEEIAECKESGSPIMGIGDNCHIQNAIIDKNTYIGNNVTINCGEKLEDGDYGTHTVQDGIVVVKKRAIIPSGTVI